VKRQPFIVAIFVLATSFCVSAKAQTPVKIAIGFPSVSFLPVWAAQALHTFDQEKLDASLLIPGGDPASLAALDAGDIDLAAVGTEPVLRAAAKGQPFEIVYSVMSEVTLQLIVSKSFLESRKVSSTDRLDKRLAALKGAIIGVGGVGGAQEGMARWLAAKAGLNPRTDIQIVAVGSPPALQAALENHRIDAFLLSPPEGYLAEKQGSGSVLISLASEFPELAKQPFLSLVAKKPINEKIADVITRTVKALQLASAASIAKPEETALAVQKQRFSKADPDAIVAAVKTLNGGISDGGTVDVESMSNMFTFFDQVGTKFEKRFDAKTSENDLWTNKFVAAAKQK
jgi:ABC-type nitrate/sulfonate/bicarbonate transport system substrate-binding protein